MTKTPYMEIFLAQRGLCFYCGRPMGITRGNGRNNYTVDHFHPKANGNKINGNAVLAHAQCNLEKGNREPTADEEVRFKVLYRRIKERRGELKRYAREGWAA